MMDKSKMAAEIFNKHAIRYQEKYMDVSRYATSLNLFCDLIKPQHAEILELACGPGNITKYLLDKRPDLKILGTDLSENMIQLARQNNPTATFHIMDCRELISLTEKYDAIMCGFCLPYLSKQEALQLISNASKLLRPNGVIYISTMEDDYNKSEFLGPKDGSGDRVYTNYHEAGYLTKQLEQNQFASIEIKRQEFPVQEGEPVTDLILIAQK